jgi:hypothetical protein
MAVEIGASGGFGENVSLHGDEAARFMHEVARPSNDERRLAHLERADKAYDCLFSAEPISELPSAE